MLSPVDDRNTAAQHRLANRCPIASLAVIVAMMLLGFMLLSTSARSGGLFPFFPPMSNDDIRTRADRSGTLKTNRFDIDYVEPKNPAHRHIYELLQKEHVLEKVQALLAPVKLPIRIALKLEDCDGIANATFWDDVIKVCYEYIDYVLKHASKVAADGLPLRDAMIGPAIEVFLHEAGHAVLEVLDIPFFGREEEVADYFATYILLQLCKDDARRLILGTSFVSGAEAIDEQGKAPELHLLADTHSLPAQRYFNRWCMAYGADPLLFADAIGNGMLPQSRAKHCRYEYQTNEFAFKTLISPYIDEKLKQDVWARNWFALPTTDRQMCSMTISMAVSH